MARPGRPERNRAARSFRQLRRFHHVINSDKVFGTHNPPWVSPVKCVSRKWLREQKPSIILVGVGLWIRLGILETPVFQALLNNYKIEKTPILEVIRKQPKQIILSALLRLSEQAPFYIFTAFIFAYAVGTLHMSRN